jgi:Baseplate J-like protein
MPAILSNPTLADLLIEDDQATIYAAMLQIAQTLNLPVTSWQAGDPTRSTFFVEAAFLEKLEQIVVGFIQSGFLDYAGIPNADGTANPWLAIIAKQMFNIDVPTATYATTDVTLTNAGGAVYVIAAGDLTLKCSASGATYHNTTGITLTGVGTGGATGTVTVIADQPGSGSSAGATEIDTLVTALLGVTCTNPAAAVGLDQQAPATTVQQCRDKAASLSPNGPAAAYQFVALNSALTGVQTITRARVYPDSDTGDVQVYVAGASGSVGSGDVTAAQNAINQWATPLCITPTVSNSNNVTVAVTYTLWLYQSVGQTTAQIQAAVLTALEDYFAGRPIGGDIIPPATTGNLYADEIKSVIGRTFPNDTFRVSVSLPSGDTSLGNGDVAVIGSVTGTINLVANP